MRINRTRVMIGLSVAMSVGLWLQGCQSSDTTAPTSQESNPVKRMMAEPSAKAGAELWAENCTRCHNARPPQYYSDAQWKAIVHHMRLRANLTGEEQKKITEFLQAAN